MDLQAHLLGGFEAGGSEMPEGIRSHLLAYLAYLGGWVSRERIAFLFWPDTDDASARRNLRQVINRLKKLSLPVPLEADTQRLRWQVSTDVTELRNAVGRQDWARVLELYRGELLAGWIVDAASGFGAWLEIERESLAAVRRRAALARAGQLAEQGDYQVASALLGALLSAEEPDEELTASFMSVAYLAGQRDAALQAFRQLENDLKSEYDAEPLEATSKLAALILKAEPLDTGAIARQRTEVPLAVQRPPRMIGRDVAVQEALTAGSRLVLVRGEAGVGKSRLLEEIATGVVKVRCLENLRSVPFQPLGRLLEQLLTLHGLDGVPEAQATELARLVPAFAPGRAVEPGDPETARGRLLEAIATYLEGGLSGSTDRFQLVFDDLQWADSATLELLTLLAERGELRLLGAFRRFEASPELTELISSVAAAGLLSIVELWPLDVAGMSALIAHLMDSEERSPLFSQWLFESTGGNIMFALETLKALFESGGLRSGASGWESDLDTITQNYSELEQPSAIREVISRRISRVGEPARRAVQAAAVVGEGFDAQVLAGISGASTWEILDALEALEQLGLLTNGNFRHDLIRQSIYQSIPAERLRYLHGQAALVLEPSDQPIVVAAHHHLAGNTAAAAAGWVRAAVDLRNRGLLEDALELLESSVLLAREAEDSSATWRLLGEICGTLRGLARFNESEAIAEEILASCPDVLPRAEAYGHLAGILLQQGRIEDSERAARKGVELALKAGDERLHMSISTLLVSSLFYRQELAEAAQLTADAVERLRLAGSELDLAVQLSNHGAILDDMGRSKEALPLHEEALEIVQRLKARQQMVDIVLNFLICHTELGTVDDQVLALAASTLQAGRFEGTDTLRNNYAYALMGLGRSADAEAEWEILVVESLDPTLKLIAWARLARLYQNRGEAARHESGLRMVRELSLQTEFPVALVAAAVTLLEGGVQEDVALALDVVERAGLERGSIPESLGELDRLLAGLETSAAD